MRTKIVFLLIVLLLSLKVEGAFNAPDFNFTHYTTENGLSSNSVRDIVQDTEGFMWFATDGGLVRFDGSSSRVFIPGDTENSDIFTLSLCTIPDGLLVGTDHRLYRYDPVKESLTPIPIVAKDGKSHVEGAVVDICTDSNDEIWVSVETKGIYRLSPEGETIGEYAVTEANNYIGMLYVDSNDIVWGASTTNGGSIFRFDRNRARFEPFRVFVDGEEINSSSVAVTCDSHGDYWLGTWEHGLVKFNGRTGEGTRMSSIDPSCIWHVHSITEYSPTMLLIGSDSGLTLVDISTGEYKVYQSDELNLQSLTDRFIYPVVKDTDGGFWIGTYYRGVNYLSRDSKRFRRWYHSRFANSVSGNVISRFCEDSGGNIWIGTADGGLSRYNPVSHTFCRFPLGARRENENINALCADGDRMWVGTYAAGAGVINVHTGGWMPVSVEGSHSYSSYAICKDSKGDIWMASTGTLTKYNPERNMFEKVDNFGAWIIDIDEDHEGYLWLSTQGCGLYKVDPVSGKRVNYVASKTPGSLPHDHINNVMVDENGVVYVATILGVYRYDREQDIFEAVAPEFGNIAAQSIEKSGSDLWISTLSGLIKLKPDGEARVFTYADGISDNQFVPGASLHASDGKIYYGSVHGFCQVDPVEVKSTSGEPVLKFTGLDIVNQPVAVGDSHLPESLNFIDELVLTHADHTFSVYFSALSYSNPEGNVCKYKLEGFDKSWHSAGKDNRATYSNLPPGFYTLRVKGANSDGVWNKEGISLKIVVRPAWYASTFMKILYLVIGIASLLLGVRYVLWRMERNHIIELDRISSNKEKEMFRSKLKFFTVVAHEIRTPVSLIIGPLEKILDSTESFTPSVKEDLKVIDRNARRLLSLINQLLDFKKVEGNALPMGFRHEKIVPLVENVAERFHPSLEHKGVRLLVDCPDPELTVDVDPEAVTKLVSNLLNNARKFTKSYVKIVCRKIDDDRFIISVEDDGIGIGKENRDKIFKPFFQVLDNINETKGGTGLGLSIVKSVVDAHHGSIELDSVPGKGAKFTVVLPICQENVVPVEEKSVEEVTPDVVETAVETEKSGPKPVLLVVDDNEEMVNFISANFEKHYEVVTAANGKEAMERMGQKSVSLIICDWMMPVMDGVEFLKFVRGNENYCHIPFVMLTAKTDNLSKIETMKSGADLYIEKPFSMNYLEACIGNLLEMRGMLRRKYSDSPLEPLTTLAPTQVDNELLRKLQTLIEENFSNQDLNVDFLADHLGISRSGLYAKIRSLAEVTPNELIQITRLKKAAELLAEGKYRISEICYMVGFNSSSYFSRCFQKQFGMKPGEFAAKQNEG